MQTLCHLAKLASSADAVVLLDCVRWQELSACEMAATTLYLQHNAKWVDRRFSTAAAWRMLNARSAASLREHAAVAASATHGNSYSGLLQLYSNARASKGDLRAARFRTIHWGLR